MASTAQGGSSGAGGAGGAGGSTAGAAGATPSSADEWGRNKKRKDEALPAGKGQLLVGVAQRYLDGPIGVSMAGYGGRLDGRRTHWSQSIKGSAGFYGMQSIKVAAIEVGAERIALVKSPQMSSESYLTDAIARHLKKTHNLDFAGRVITMAGHSHHATARYWPVPDTLGNAGVDTFDSEVAENTAMVYADAIAEAWGKREEAEMGHAYQDDWDPDDEVYRDRRGENNPTYGKDPRLDVLAFRRKSDKTPLSAIIHFAIHGTVFGGDNDMFTEDAPGHVEHKFEEAFFAREGKPIYGMFAQASGGDASPAGDALDHPELARLERLGEAAAPKILALYDTIEWKSDLELAVRSERIELHHERIYKGRPWEKELANGDKPYLWGGWQCKVAGFKEGESMQGRPKLCVDLGKLLKLLGADVPHNAVHETYLTAARLGDLWMITLPGEPTWSVTKYAREAAAKKLWDGSPMKLMVVGYSQDHLLYMSAPDDWYMGGYEAEMNLWGPGLAPFLVDEGLGMVDAMMAGNNGPTLFEESPTLAPVLEWKPRTRERSIDPGTIVAQPPSEVARTQTVEFSANCGDPALGSPQVVVLREGEGGAFNTIPAVHGWADHVYDNSRYEMISAYDPDPPQLDNASVAERTHLWRFYWQVPSGWPTGNYRMQIRCKVLPSGSGEAEPKALELDSPTFAVKAAEGTALKATLDGTTLSLEMRVPGVEQVTAASPAPGQGKWISGGYRLLDYDVKHTEPALVKASLKAEVLDDKGKVIETVEAPFDASSKKNKASLKAAPTGKWSVRAWISGDAVPAKVDGAPLTRRERPALLVAARPARYLGCSLREARGARVPLRRSGQATAPVQRFAR